MGNRRTFDVDIDVAPNTNKAVFGVRAMLYRDEAIHPHPSGYYLNDVPVDPITGHCAFDAEWGDEHGMYKVDLLTNTAYTQFKSKEQLLEYANKEPHWQILENKKIVESLPHISKHYDIVNRVKPASIHDLADVLALIRPGKEHHIEAYLENKAAVRRVLYKRTTKAYFKKSHSYSYAMMIIAIMNTKKIAVIW
jgi:hypothetical protein